MISDSTQDHSGSMPRLTRWNPGWTLAVGPVRINRHHMTTRRWRISRRGVRVGRVLVTWGLGDA